MRDFQKIFVFIRWVRSSRHNQNWYASISTRKGPQRKYHSYRFCMTTPVTEFDLFYLCRDLCCVIILDHILHCYVTLMHLMLSIHSLYGDDLLINNKLSSISYKIKKKHNPWTHNLTHIWSCFFFWLFVGWTNCFTPQYCDKQQQQKKTKLTILWPQVKKTSVDDLEKIINNQNKNNNNNERVTIHNYLTIFSCFSFLCRQSFCSFSLLFFPNSTDRKNRWNEIHNNNKWNKNMEKKFFL